MRLDTLSGWFGPGQSGATYTLQLSEDDVRALARNWAVLPSQLAPKIEALLDATIASAIEKGQCGLAADRLAADGSIEVGRADELPGIVRGADAYFHSIEGMGDRL